MRGIERVAYLSVRVTAALVTAASLLFASAGAAGATGTGTPTPSPATATESAPALTLQVGSVTLSASVPLTLGGLLTIGSAHNTPRPTPAPSTSTPAGPPPSSSSLKPKPSSSPAGTTAAPPVQPGFQQPPAGSSTGATHTRQHTSPQPTTSKHTKPRGGLLLMQRVLPNSGVLLLVSVVVVLALGVAAFVRLSGRRGGRRV
jgi:hypothetical protein